MTDPIDPSKFLKFNEDEIARTALTLECVLYFSSDLQPFLEEISSSIQEFEIFAGSPKAGFFRSESMKNFSKTKSSISDITKKWRESGPKKLRYLSYFFDDPRHHLDGFSAELRSANEQNRILRKKCNYIRFVFPPAIAASDFLIFCIKLARDLPFRSGHAGFSIHKGLYDANRATTASLQFGLRYVAIDISDLDLSAWAVRRSCIKGVFWLNFLGFELLDELGVRIDKEAVVSTKCEFEDLRYGLLMRCGDVPILGDRNRIEDLSPYLEAFNILQPLLENTVDSHPPMNSIDNLDASEITERWLMRLCEVSS